MGYADGAAHLHDVAADSYHRFQEDVDMAAKLKVRGVAAVFQAGRGAD